MRLQETPDRPLDPPRFVQTERLRLRPPRLADAPLIYRRYARDAETTRFLSWRPHESETDTAEFIGRCLDDWAEARSFAYVIELRQDPGRAAGMAQLSPLGHEIVLGYVLSPELRGRAIVPEALKPLIDWSLACDRIWRVSAFCDAENAASARVMIKAGLKREGLMRRYSVFPNVDSAPRDCLVYATTPEDWRPAPVAPGLTPR